jgi:hypothetical protein
MTLFPHITVHILQNILSHNCKNIINDILCFTLDTIFLWPYIPDANNKCLLVGQLQIILWGKVISLGIINYDDWIHRRHRITECTSLTKQNLKCMVITEAECRIICNLLKTLMTFKNPHENGDVPRKSCVEYNSASIFRLKTSPAAEFLILHTSAET